MVLFLMVEVNRSVCPGPLKREIQETRSGRDHVDKRGGDQAPSKGEPEGKTHEEPTSCATWWS